MGYLIFGTIGLACLVLYCLCACLNSALSDEDDWEMDHINGLSTKMNLYWINIPLSIAFSLNVLYLNNMGFHLFEFGTLDQIYFGSVRSTKRSQALYLIPPKALLILKNRPSPPPPLAINFPWSALYTLLSTTYIPTFRCKSRNPLEILQNPLPTVPRWLIMTGRFGQFFCPIFCCLIDANCPITGDQVLNCSMHHQKITSVSYSASNKAVFIFSTKLRNRLNLYSTVLGC